MRKIELFDSDGNVVFSGYSVFGDLPSVPPSAAPDAGTTLAAANDSEHPKPAETTREAA